VTYGWVEKDGRQHLAPVTITLQAEHGKTSWCRGLFTDYEMFGVKARLVPLTGRSKNKNLCSAHNDFFVFLSGAISRLRMQAGLRTRATRGPLGCGLRISDSTGAIQAHQDFRVNWR